MTAALYQFPVSRDLRAARLVVANPAAHDPDVLDTALTVIEWNGTDADREKIARFPNTDLITGRTADQLTEARRIAAAAGAGEAQNLPALLTAQEVLEAHGVTEDSVALVQVEAAAMLTRMRARKVPAGDRGMIRGELGRFAVLACFAAVVLTVAPPSFDPTGADMETMETTALAIPERTELVALFKQEGGLDPIIARIEAEVRSHIPDVTTKRGRDAIASLAYKVARSRTTLDDAGKTLTEEQRRQIAVVDAARRSMRERLDALKDEARKPLDAWEAAEAERVAALKVRMTRLREAAPAEETADAFAALIARVEATAIDETWQEFAGEAALVKATTLARLRDAAELARLRAEAAARAEADRIAAEAAAEAERRRIEAEAAAAREAEEARLAAERAERLEREKAEAAERAAKEAGARAKAEAERQAREAAEREAALQRELEASRAREAAAAQAERDRIAEAARAEEEARAKRAADAAHRARVQGAIAEALEAYMQMGAMGVADAIIGGAIPHVKVAL